MALNIIRQGFLQRYHLVSNRILSKTYSSLYEPDYLEALKPKIPLCPPLNVQVKGYAYPVLESYQSLIHKLSRIFNIEVDESWAYPHKDFKVCRYMRGTSVVDATYELKLYIRNTRISELSALKYPVFIRILEATLPEGVTLHVEPWDDSKAMKRYIPNTGILERKSQLESLKNT